MTAITRIELRIQTGDADDAGMDNGEIYLGLAGREFHVDSPGDQFKPSDEDRFIFTHGPAANVTDPKENDPTDPWQLDSDDIGRCPRYIRFEPRRVGGRVEEWNVASVQLVVKSGNSIIFTEERLGDDGANLWMGGEFKSRYLYFR
jgi:hypothetical protein